MHGTRSGRPAQLANNGDNISIPRGNEGEFSVTIWDENKQRSLVNDILSLLGLAKKTPTPNQTGNNQGGGQTVTTREQAENIRQELLDNLSPHDAYFYKSKVGNTIIFIERPSQLPPGKDLRDALTDINVSSYMYLLDLINEFSVKQINISSTLRAGSPTNNPHAGGIGLDITLVKSDTNESAHFSNQNGTQMTEPDFAKRIRDFSTAHPVVKQVLTPWWMNYNAKNSPGRANDYSPGNDYNHRHHMHITVEPQR